MILSQPRLLSPAPSGEEADVSQDDLCRVFEYNPVDVRRVLRGTGPPTGRFCERLLAYVASRGNGPTGRVDVFKDLAADGCMIHLDPVFPSYSPY